MPLLGWRGVRSRLAERLGERLSLLTRGAADAAGRHRTLRAALAWTHGLLAPAEQQVLAALSVFAGSFTVEAAVAVAGPDDPDGVLDALDSLRDDVVSGNRETHHHVFALGEFFAQMENASRGHSRFACHLGDAREEKGDPLLPRSSLAHGLKEFVVGLPMLFEIVREIQDWLMKDAPLGQQKGDQQTADASVAVEEGMDRLELHVRERDLYERRQVIDGVQVLLECTECLGDHMMRRRYEGGGGQRRPS